MRLCTRQAQVVEAFARATRSTRELALQQGHQIDPVARLSMRRPKLESTAMNTTIKSLMQAMEDHPDKTPVVGERPPRPYDSDGIGMTKRAKRIFLARERISLQVKYDHPDWSDQQIRREVNERLKAFESMPPGVVKQYNLLEPTCVAPRRDRVIRKVEIAALRRTPEMQELEEHLRGTPSIKPTAVGMPIAILEHAAFSSVVPEIKQARDDFFGSDDLLDWAFDEPTAGSSVTSHAGIGKNLHDMLADPSNDPEVLVRLNLQAIKRLAEDHERIGRYCLIDGTAIHSFTRQIGTLNDREEEIINRGTRSTFIKHEQKGGSVKKWRGYELLTITDLKSTLPLAWILISAQPTAYEVRQVLDLLLDAWPECPIKYLVGDSEFDREEITRMCHEDFGIVPVFDLRKQVRADIGNLTDLGVPKCIKCKKPMKLTHREKFWTIDDREAVGLPRREPIELKNARLRWECETGCKRKVEGKADQPLKLQTRPKDYWRLFTMLPRSGTNKWAHLRTALMFRRNSIESVFSQLKREHVGLVGNGKARWIRTQNEMAWMLGLALLAQTLRREAQVGDGYECVLAEAERLELLK